MAGCVRKWLCLRPLLALLVGCFCLFLTGCGAKLPDSGTLPPVTVAKNTPFHLDVSTEEVRKKGVRIEGLSPAIEKQLLTIDGMEAAGGPGPGTLSVRVEVRDISLAGTTSANHLKTAGVTLAALTVGAVAGAAVGAYYGLTNPFCFCVAPGAIAGAALGAAAGAAAGLALSLDDAEAGEIWAMRAGVGMAWDGRPETLEEIVVSTGPDGVHSRASVLPALEKALAQRIRDALMPPASPSEDGEA